MRRVASSTPAGSARAARRASRPARTAGSATTSRTRSTPAAACSSRRATRGSRTRRRAGRCPRHGRSSSARTEARASLGRAPAPSQPGASMRPRMLALALAGGAALAPCAAASDRLALDATQVKLAVSADGETAVVTYRSHGRLRHALVSGAVNALPPSEAVPQVRFAIDWTGGWETHRNGRWWQRVGNHCRSYDGPDLAGLVAACDAPDGSHWALQQWQPKPPHRGSPPYGAGQTASERAVSRWIGPPAEVEGTPH